MSNKLKSQDITVYFYYVNQAYSMKILMGDSWNFEGLANNC